MGYSLENIKEIKLTGKIDRANNIPNLTTLQSKWIGNPYEPPILHHYVTLAVPPLHRHNLTEDEWRDYMKYKISIDDIPELYNKSSMISMAPQALLEVKPQSFYPQILTIGPLYQKFESSFVDSCKALCVKRFMQRHEIPDLEELMQHLIPELHDLRSIYLGLPQYSFESLQLLVTVDTIFIHELLLFMWNICYNFQPMESSYFDTLFNNYFTHNLQLRRDLMLIGNQIPMPFLEKIALKIPKKPDFPSVSHLEFSLMATVLHLTNPFFRGQRFIRSKFNINCWALNGNYLKCKHLLDSLYFSCTQTISEESTRKSVNSYFSKLSILRAWKKSQEREAHEKKFVRLPTASQLSKVGICFKACEGNISMVKYHKKKLELDLPRLVVEDSTEDVLRNLLAHEQNCKDGVDFTMYAVIMDSLIDTPEDLAILTKAQVIDNHLGDDERSVKMWNNLRTNIPIPTCESWDGMIEDVMHHYQSRWRPVYVEFHEKYFSRPWLTASVLAAILLLVFTLLQTVYTILGYY